MRPRKPSPIPYQDTTTTGYDYRYFNTGPAYGTTGYFQDNSRPYDTDSGAYSADSYSEDYPKSPIPYQKYQYPDDSGSYENYGYTKDDNFNITIERYGGFGGTGDTRGFGAYDYPKKVNHDVPQDIHDDEPRIRTEFPDLLRLGRTRTVYHHRRNPMHVHPLPPPL